MYRKILLSTLAALFVNFPAKADDISEYAGWNVQVTPYVWMAGLSGNVSATQAPPIFSVDKSFGDILDDLGGAFFVSGLARRGSFVILTDLNYVAISERDTSPIPVVFDSVKAEVKQFSGTLAAGISVYQGPAGTFDVLAGARGWFVDAEVTGEGGIAGPLSESDTWSFIDPIVALRGRRMLSDHLSVTGYFDIGGAGVGSDLTWQALAALNYAFTSRFSASAGYRHLSVDYQDGGQLLDVELSGPIVGVTWKF